MPAPRSESLGLSPESRLAGSFRPGGSKSLAQRALVAAALARGETTIEGLPDGEDALAARAVLAAVGVECEPAGGSAVRVRGVPPAERGLAAVFAGAVAVGESGTLARLATAALALASRPGQRWTVSASGTLLFRRSRPLFDALARAGVELGRQNLPGTWPVQLVSVTPPQEVVLVSPSSSQEASGLLLALAAHAGTRALVVRGRLPSAPYVEMTRAVLARFGAEVDDEVDEEAAGGQRDAERRLLVRGPLVAPEAPLALEPDASSAAVALAAACLSGGELTVPGLARGSLQGDARVVEHLAALGCDARADAGGLSARGFPARGAELDLAGEPDLAPVLAAVAAGAALRHGARSLLSGLGTLAGKESDRLGGLASALEQLGLAVEAGPDSLAIAPRRRELEPEGAAPPRPPLVLDPRGDHRMAFAFALLGLLCPGVRVRDPGCVAKSWPSFWDDLERLGAVLERD